METISLDQVEKRVIRGDFQVLRVKAGLNPGLLLQTLNKITARFTLISK